MKESWWEQKAVAAQTAADRKDSKAFYSYVREVFGPSQSSVAPVRSKNGSVLYTDVKSIKNRWVEHYSELLNRSSNVNIDIVNSIKQHPIVHEMSEDPTRKEVASAAKLLNNDKAPGIDGLTAEILKCGGKRMDELLHKLILHYWRKQSVPQDWIDAILISLHKSGVRDNCGNFRGISLLSVVGKVLARVCLDRLTRFISPNAISESQCGFRPHRGTADMIFTARQLQEKCAEQNLDLYQCFVDLSKAFDTVNREALWIVLHKSGCPDTFVNIIKSLHVGMKARVNLGGGLSEPFDVDNGVKQGDLDAPTLFAIYFAAMLQVAFSENNVGGIYIRYRTTGNVFDLSRLRAKSKVFTTVVRDLLYADDCDLVAHTVEDMQSLVSSFDSACDAFGLTINIKKTVVMYQHAPGKLYKKPTIIVKDSCLKVVDTFTYLGGTLSRTGSLDEEISARIQKAANSFGKLEVRVWSQHKIKFETKVKVYSAFVLSSLLYTCETWTTYARHLKSLERFHQKCLRHILKVTWQSLTPDTDILSQSGLPSIEAVIMLNRLRWSGHLFRLEDVRIPKQIFYGEVALGARKVGKPKKRFKDSLKDTLKKINIPFKQFETLATHRLSWKQSIRQGVTAYEEKRVNHEHMKRAARKGTLDITSVSADKVAYSCSQCSRICMSNAGLKSHLRAHDRKTK